MAGNVKTYTDAGFEADVVNSGKLTIVDFWAEECVPCRMMAPILEQLADEYAGRVEIGKMDMGQDAKIPGKYGVRAMPTLLFFRNGVVQKQIVGVRNKTALKQEIDRIV
ncbi:MAG: thioredoxin [Nitrospinota bacterium]|nr:thioredoxin [Nitrospinota bacterium]